MLMGNKVSTTEISEHGSGIDEEEISGTTCPITGKSYATNKQQPHSFIIENNEKKADENENACPVVKYRNPNVYNVYGQKIDPSNQMPQIPNQEPHPEQTVQLPKERVQSKIRKGGTDSTWLYPSEQMFFNALKRKGKANGITEEDMDMLVKIHNGTNERAWKKVLEWEHTFHKCDCDDPTLLKFLGKPSDISPKAWVKSTFLGYPKPFDRHDWIVDRCGKEVRYILDFYYKDTNEDEEMTIVKNEDGFLVPRHVHIDVRPALDTFESFYDRVRFLLKKKQDI
jgi:cytochrome c heme-lyase